LRRGSDTQTVSSCRERFNYRRLVACSYAVLCRYYVAAAPIISGKGGSGSLYRPAIFLVSYFYDTASKVIAYYVKRVWKQYTERLSLIREELREDHKGKFDE